MSPNSSFLFVTNFGSADVSAYAIASNGALTPAPGSPFPAGSQPAGQPVGVAVSPNGSFIYVANSKSLDNNISAYAIGSNGALTPAPGSPFAAGTQPWAAAVSLDGSFLYVTNQVKLWAYAIGSDGALTQASGSPFGAGTNPGGVAVATVTIP